jgi:hypothetical protein
MATINSLKNDVGKLYGKLSPVTQANLVFGALADLDKLRADAIESYVQWRDYQSLDADYK